MAPKAIKEKRIGKLNALDRLTDLMGANTPKKPPELAMFDTSGCAFLLFSIYGMHGVYEVLFDFILFFALEIFYMFMTLVHR